MTVTDAPCAVMNRLPEAFLDCPANRLAEILPGPTLFDLPGRDPRPLFVSTLLHGNEDVGLLAVQRLLASYQARELPRALSIFIGNVAAARRHRQAPSEAPRGALAAYAWQRTGGPSQRPAAIGDLHR